MTVRRRPVSRDSRRRCFLASRRVEPLTDVTRLLTGASADGARRADPGHRVGRVVAFPAGQFQVLVTAAAATAAARRHAVLERSLGAFVGLFVGAFGSWPRLCFGSPVRLRPRRPRLRRRRRLPASSPSSPSSSSASSAAAAAATGTGRTTVVRSGAWKIIEVTAPGSRNSEAAGACRRALRRRLRAGFASAGRAGCSRRLPRRCCCAGLGGRLRRPRRALPRRRLLRGFSASGAAALARLARRRTGFSGALSTAGARRRLLRRELCSGRRTGFGGGSSAKAGRGSGASTSLRARVRRAGALASRQLRGARGGSRRPAAGSPSRRLQLPRLQPRPPRRAPRRRPSGAALRRVRTALFGAAGAAASAVSAASSATTSSSLPATTWSLSICGDTPAPGAATSGARWGKYSSTPAGIDRSQLDTLRFAPAVGCGSPGGPARLF